MSKGCFISVEGIDGAGKSTQILWISDWLRHRGIPFIQTREPGGTLLGEKLRNLLLSESMHPETEALLVFAARQEHLLQVIIPALERGESVLCDRFTDASFAYQCGGRGLTEKKIQALENWVQFTGKSLIQPDLTIIFDIPVSVGQERLAQLNQSDRFEQEGSSFSERVRAAYLERAAAHSDRIHVLDANRSIEDIQIELSQILESRIQHLFDFKATGEQGCQVDHTIQTTAIGI